MNEKLYELLLELPKENIINLMWSALDEMNAYNGRSRQYCILTAMGADEVEDGKFKIPDIETIKKHTEMMGL